MPTLVADLGPATFNLDPVPDWKVEEDNDSPHPLYNDPDDSSSDEESDDKDTPKAQSVGKESTATAPTRRSPRR